MDEPKHTRKRRSDSKGTVWKRKDTGGWMLKYYGEGGKQVAINLKTKSEAEARTKAAEIMAGVLNDEPLPEMIKLDPALTGDLTEYIQHHPKLAPGSIKTYTNTWRRWITMGSSAHDALSAPVLISKVEVIRRILKWYQDRGKLLSVVMPDQQPFVARARRIKPVLTVEQFQKIIDAAPDEATRRVWLLCGYCGLRSSEAANVLWSDIDRLKKVLHVRNHDASLNPFIHKWRTKTGDTRVVTMPDALINVFPMNCVTDLTPYHTVPPSQYVVHYDDDTPEHPVCRSPFTRAGSEMLTKYAQQVGIPFTVTRHDLRHFFALFMHRNGVPTIDLMIALGHTSLRTTQIYLESLDGGYKESFNVFPTNGNNGTV